MIRFTGISRAEVEPGADRCQSSYKTENIEGDFQFSNWHDEPADEETGPKAARSEQGYQSPASIRVR